MNTVLNNIMTGNLTSDAIAVTSSVVATVPDAPPEEPPVISEDGTVTYSDGTTVSQDDSGEMTIHNCDLCITVTDLRWPYWRK